MLLRVLGLVFAVLYWTPLEAAPVVITCTIDGASKGEKIEFDVEAKTLKWGDRDLEWVSGGENAIVGRDLDMGWPSSVLIERATGRFWIASVGDFCTAKDCSKHQYGGDLSVGRCFKGV